MGSLFFGLHGGVARAMPCYYGLQAIVVSISAFVHRCARDDSLSMSIETGGCEAAPYDFLRSAPAPRGPTELSPSAFAAAARVHATRPPAGPRIEMQGLHLIAPSARHGARSGSRRPSASASLRRRRIGLPAGAARASHAATLPWPCGAALHSSQRPRPEGRQHLPDALPAEGRRLRVARGRHGGPLLR